MAPPKFMGLTGKRLSRVVSAVCTTGFLLFGYDQGVMSGIITAPAFARMFPATKDNSTLQGLVTALYELGCLFGAMTILYLGDIVGRRRAVVVAGLIMTLGVIIQVTAQPGKSPLAQFIVGRIVMGFGNGINTSTIPTYQAECSQTSNRGLLICIEGGTIAIGTLIAYWIDYGASYGNDDLVWRFPIAFQIIFALFSSIPMLYLPESPRWLLTHGRQAEADTVIAALRNYEVDSIETAQERDIILDSIRASGFVGQRRTPFKALFTNGKTQHFRRMLLGAGSQWMQQIGGCNAVIYYVPILFQKSLNESHNFAMLLGGINMIVYAIFATVSWFVIERVGRRKLLLWGTVGQMLSMVLTFACLIPDTPAASKGAAAGLFTYIASFGASWLPLPWLIPAEISPVKTRAKANAMSTCANWMFNFLIVMVTPIMITNISYGTYIFFAAVNACFLPIIYLYYPETAHRSLEEIDIIFAKGYTEKISYVKAAQNLPLLSPEEIEREAIKYGLINSSSDGHMTDATDGDMYGVLHHRHSSGRANNDNEKAGGDSGSGSDPAGAGENL